MTAGICRIPAVNLVRNKAANPGWFSITHKPSGFSYLYYPTLEKAKIVAEYMEENYWQDFALLILKHKPTGEPYYDVGQCLKKMKADETLLSLLKENAVPFDELVERKIAKINNRFKW